ncbi:MAG: DNA primase [Minisyncoccia bacterium]
MSREVEQIKDRLDIVSVVSGYIEVHKAGANYKANCPFHHEKTPSFFISPSRNSYYCFGCGAKGDIFTFVEEMEGLDFRSALEHLGKKAGVEITKISPKAREESDRALMALQEANDFYASELKKHSEPHSYLLKRGITEKTIENFSLGFAPSGWRNLRDHLLGKVFTDEELSFAGLTKKGEKGNEPYDVFRERIIFPISESSGRIVGFSGRSMDEETNPPKYLNSPDSTFFNKSELLYGLDKAKHSIREKQFSILVEGQMDLLMSHQADITNTVAASGTAVTPQHIERLRKIAPRILISLDADGAGVKAAMRAATIALERGMEVKIASIKDGKDPADLILKDVDEYKNTLRSALPFIEFVWELIKKETADEKTRAKRVEKEIIPLLVLIDSSIERAQTIKTISAKSKIPERAIEEDVTRFKRSKGKLSTFSTSESYKNPAQIDSYNQSERHAAGLLFAEQGGATFTMKISDELSFLNDLEREAIILRYKPEQENLVFEVENYYGDEDPQKARQTLEEVILNFKKDILKKRLIAFTEALSRAEEKKDSKEAKGILEMIQETNNELQKI